MNMNISIVVRGRRENAEMTYILSRFLLSLSPEFLSLLLLIYKIVRFLFHYPNILAIPFTRHASRK
jgi:hypothetical protein